MKKFHYLVLIVIMFTLPLFGQKKEQDWPNLKEFQADNKELPTPSADEERIVFMGNSITIGWKIARPTFFSNPAYVNRGISGQTTPQMLVRFRADVVDLNPKVVVILAGTNDIAGNTGPSSLEMIMDNFKSMSEIAVANGIKVVLCSVLPAFDYPWRPGLDPANKIPALNAMIEDYADKNDFIYLDYFSAMDDGNNGLLEDLTYDGVHPNEAGYKVMEPLVLEVIAKALN